MYDTLGERIIHFRTKRHMTQDQLAERVGVSRQAISKWERGEANPDLYNVQALARALGVRLDDLVNGIQKETQGSSQTKRPNQQAQPSGNYVKQLLYKAKHTTNSEEAKSIKRKLIGFGLFGVVLSLFMTVGGLIGFVTAGFQMTSSFGEFNVFAPLLFMLMFAAGGTVFMISMLVLVAGLSIKVAEVTTNYLDTRETCPSCGDVRDSDEQVCSSCGYRFDQDRKTCKSCGKDNQKDDVYCRECGTLI